MGRKYYILALIIMLGGLTNLAAQNNTSLTISLYDGNTFRIELDNNTYSKSSDELYINGIEGGKHYLKVTATDSRKPVFSGYINIIEGYTTRAVIDENNSFYVYQKYKYRKERKIGETIEIEHHKEYTEYNDKVISEEEFTNLRNIVSTKSYDNTKLEICKLAIDGSYFTTDMVCSLINLLTFETYKLDLAKYAYGKTVDKRNYIKVFDTFKYEYSIMDLKDYMQNYK